jgi:glycosyl transferase family 87
VTAAGYFNPRLLRLAGGAALVIAGFGVAVLTVTSKFGNHHYSDFRIFWQAGQAVLHHTDPYPTATATRLHGQDQFVYPAPAAVMMALFALLPLPAAALLFLIASIAATAASLYIAGVRDLRCYAVVFGSLVIIQGLVMGTVTPLLMLTLAIAWRCRDRVWPVAAAASVAIGLKLFLAPIGIWMVATRRWRALSASILASLLVLLGSWAVVGLATLRTYPKLLSELTKVEGSYGFSTYALALRLGLPPSAARAVVIALLAVLSAATLAAAKKRGGDAPAFAIAVVVCLVASPIVWLHYFALLIIPVAILSPRLSWLWALPLAGWVFANLNHPAPTWKIISAHVVLAVVVAVALRRGSAGSGASAAFGKNRPAASTQPAR